jgi:ABC-type multidrug transport system permease subunit
VGVFLALSAAGAIAQTLPRGNYVSFEAWMWLPSIRYALPAVIALCFPIAAGWSALAKHASRNAGMIVFYAFFVVLNVVSLLYVARLTP